MNSTPRVRLVDVAAHLGVAPSTVSRALAGAGAIPQETRDRVRQAAEELGYRANPAAAGLKQGVTFNIGLITSLSGSWYSGALAAGADRAAAEAGYDFVVATADDIDGRSGLLLRGERLGRRVDGVIIVDVNNANGLLDRLVEKVAVPVVTVGCRHAECPSLEIDNRQVGFEAGEHLSSSGHRSVVVLGLETPNEMTIDNTSERIAGFVKGASRSAVMRSTLSRTGPAERRNEILAATAAATAVFCTSDELAIEVIAVLTRNGRRVPDDIAVIGVDDHPLAEAVGLTTVGQNPAVIGRDAATMLMAQIDHQTGSIRIVVPTRLTVRATTRDSIG